MGGMADAPQGASEGLGGPGPIPVTPGNVGRRAAATLPPPMAAPAQAPARDPLSRPYLLPSRGVYYQALAPGFDGRVVISPMRGEQEETLAGAQGNPQAQVEALRHVTEQCIDTRGVPFNSLLVDDWNAAMLHFLALSAGSDVVGLRPTCPYDDCKKDQDQSKALTSLGCTVIRLAEPGETVEEKSGDETEAAIIAEIESENEDADGGVRELILTPEDAAEPFTTAPLPIGNQRVTWRYHRLSDLVKAEEFAARTAGNATKPGSPLHSYLMALQIVAIDGQRQATLQAWRWVKQQPSVVLSAWREEMANRAFGYDVVPRFRCKHCGRSFKTRLPLDGSLFRRRASA
jgi:hypothetical protein